MKNPLKVPVTGSNCIGLYSLTKTGIIILFIPKNIPFIIKYIFLFHFYLYIKLYTL